MNLLLIDFTLQIVTATSHCCRQTNTGITHKDRNIILFAYKSQNSADGFWQITRRQVREMFKTICSMLALPPARNNMVSIQSNVLKSEQPILVNDEVSV